MTGMKEGAGSDPFADDPGTDSTDDDAESGAEGADDTERAGEDAGGSDREHSQGDDQRAPVQPGELPYKHARDTVKEGRKQTPIFLKPENDEERIPELIRELEDRFDGEHVYRTDVLEAAVEVAAENPDLMERKLGKWGYGWE